MKILVIGGTRFLGYYIVKSALRAGHDVTIFNRGVSSKEVPDRVKFIKGDRTKKSDIEKLTKQNWDLVIDTCGYVPDDIELLAGILKNNIDKYLFVSSISVYDSNQRNGSVTEDAPVLKLPIDADPNERTFQYYGEKKALCEKKVIHYFGDNSIIIRPGLIVGPRDQTYRFPYWVERVSEGGQILAPGNQDASVQVIDVRDLADWIIKLGKNDKTGIYNATGPEEIMTFQSFFEECRKILNMECSFTWVDEKFLLEKEVGEWIEIPLWLSEENSELFDADFSKAINTGLTFRPISETIQDTYDWFKDFEKEDFRSKALTREKEKQLLEDWKQSN